MASLVVHAPMFLILLLILAPNFFMEIPYPAIYWSRCERAFNLYRHPAGPQGPTSFIFIRCINSYCVYQTFVGKFAPKIKSCINLSLLSKVSPCKVSVHLTCCNVPRTVPIFPKLGCPCPLKQYGRMLLIVVVVNLVSKLEVHPEWLGIAGSLGGLNTVH